jgi:DUF1680 family protein
MAGFRNHRIDRRQVLGALSAGSALGALGPAFANPPRRGERVEPRDGTHPVRAYGLGDVRLLDGPFRDAQQRNAGYLRRLDADRLLHNFRKNAGLAPKGEIYGGWESQEPWVNIRCHGHTLGHLLSALALHHAATAEEEFRQRCDYVVSELAACQEARGDGLVCAFPDGDAQLLRSLAGQPFEGVPWYTMHKIFAGLRDAHLLTGNAQALEVLVGLTEWTRVATEPLDDARMQKMLDREHGGMNEILADVYALTGDRRHLDLARRFSHRALLEPLVQQRDVLDGLHSNTQIPKVIGFSRLYELTGERRYEDASRFFWDRVVAHRSFATGGNGDRELFFSPAEFAQRLGSAKTMETCCTHNLLKLTRRLFQHEPAARFGDYYERALLNGILASQDPDSGMVTYFQATRPGYVKLYCTPFDSFWCCTGSGIENHAKYGDSIYFHDGRTLFVNLFIASRLDAAGFGLELTQSTRFPLEERTLLRMKLRRPKRFALQIRHPAWCRALSISINGAEHTVSREPGRFVGIERRWRSGDEVQIGLPMHAHAEPLPNASQYAALLYGPMVLAGRLGTAGLTPGADLIINERESGTMLNDPVDVPAWQGTAAELVASLARHDAARFTSRFSAQRTVEFVPYYAIAHERYNLYWKVAPEPQVAGRFHDTA